MKTKPTLDIELSLRNQGYKYVIGVDEAGRGGLALGVVAAAVCVPEEFNYEGIKDSKKLSSKKRELFYNKIVSECDYAIAYVDEKIIDAVNILNATKLAMRNAILQMGKSSFAIVDGNFVPDLINIPAKPVINGDNLSVSISCASILAKHYRDTLLMQYHNEFPIYEWDKNKTYGTKRHKELIELYGPCMYHRKTFSGVKEHLK